MNILCVIPARLGSTRLPQKPLAKLGDKPLIQWVYENAKKIRGINGVVIATDHELIRDTARQFDAQVIMTPVNCTSGTDRVAAVDAALGPKCADLYINLQGDEPFMEPSTVEAAVDLVTSGRFKMATAATAFKNDRDRETPSMVKVQVDRDSRAMTFSRLPLPCALRHLGLYVFTRETLLTITRLPPSALEQAEKLEQLRALEAGIPIGVAIVQSVSFGIDTPSDLERAQALV